jgi:methionyl-tRNA formyltransferase
LSEWKLENQNFFDIELLSTVKNIKEKRDILFLISCSEIVKQQHRDLFDYCLVIHASDLPKGKGWSPHVWAVVEGESQLCISLLNADDVVDSGDIWKKIYVTLDGTELYDEINELLFKAELELMDWAIQNIFDSEAIAQTEVSSNYLRKRTPEDSELDVHKTIAEQINLLRICDPNRFPAYFYLNNQKYIIKIEKA